jgi:hypothetical protein
MQWIIADFTNRHANTIEVLEIINNSDFNDLMSMLTPLPLLEKFNLNNGSLS